MGSAQKRLLKVLDELGGVATLDQLAKRMGRRDARVIYHLCWRMNKLHGPQVVVESGVVRRVERQTA